MLAIWALKEEAFLVSAFEGRQTMIAKIAPFLLSRLFAQTEQRDLLGIYEEYFRKICDSKGIRFGRLWYWGQLISVITVTLYNSTKWSLIIFANFFGSSGYCID
ncbi:hypothetical protein KAR48_09150 [bacterium]|nr:hypothetical protein [bacterium]